MCGIFLGCFVECFGLLVFEHIKTVDYPMACLCKPITHQKCQSPFDSVASTEADRFVLEQIFCGHNKRINSRAPAAHKCANATHATQWPGMSDAHRVYVPCNERPQTPREKWSEAKIINLKRINNRPKTRQPLSLLFSGKCDKTEGN